MNHATYPLLSPLTISSTTQLARAGRASNSCAVRVTTDTRNLEDGVDDASDTLTSNQTSSDRITVNIEATWVLLRPEISWDSAHDLSGTVDGLGDDKGQRNAHHVRVIRTDPLKAANPEIVADEDHERAEDGKHNGENARRGGHGQFRVSDGDGHSAPGRHGGYVELTVLSTNLKNARISIIGKLGGLLVFFVD